MNWIKCLALAVLPVALSAALSACGGGANDAPATPADFASAVSAQRAPQAPAAANVFELADVLAYIRINNLYIPTQIYQAAQVAGLDATQLDGLYGLSPERPPPSSRGKAGRHWLAAPPWSAWARPSRPPSAPARSATAVPQPSRSQAAT